MILFIHYVPDVGELVSDSESPLLSDGCECVCFVCVIELTVISPLEYVVLPVVAAVLLLIHFLMIRKQGISGPL